jgi:hypothetical protein
VLSFETERGRYPEHRLIGTEGAWDRQTAEERIDLSVRRVGADGKTYIGVEG